MPLERKLFTQGMNGGSEERFLGEGEYRYALNVRSGSSDNDNIGAIENTKGNTKVELSLPPGTNTCIGALEDKNQRKVYYFVYNSSSNHSIAEYNAKTNQAELLFTSSELNFDLDHLITGANIVDDRILKWTDDFSEPKELDVVRIKLRTTDQILGDNRYPVSISDEQLISAIKYAPLAPPTAEYSTDWSTKINNIGSKFFQFRYQYVYLNNEKSAWSPISKLEISQGDAFIQNKQYQSTRYNNSIVVKVNGGSRLVKQINFAVREGNYSNFYIAEELTKQERIQVGNDFDITWRFNNDTVNLPITLAESLKLFDDVPLLAKSQELIDGNRLAYGNVVNGFDQVDTDVNITPVYLGNSLDFLASISTTTGSVTTEVDVRPNTGGNLNNYTSIVDDAKLTFEFNDPLEVGDIIVVYIKVIRGLTDMIDTSVPIYTWGIAYNNANPGSPSFPLNQTPNPNDGNDQYPTNIAIDTDIQTQKPIYEELEVVITAGAGDTFSSILSQVLQAEQQNPKFNTFDNTFLPGPAGDAFGSNAFGATPVSSYTPAPLVQGTVSGNSIELRLGQYYQAPDSPLNIENDTSAGGNAWNYSFFSYFAKHVKEGGDVKRTFKVGAKHKFALAYSDRAGRLSTAMRKDNMSVDTDWYNEIPNGKRGVIGMDLEINHQAPAWADYYHVLYSKNTTIGRYLQAVVKDAVFDIVTDTWSINIDYSTIDFKERFTDSTVSYDFSNGDRIRWVKSDQSDENSYFGDNIDVAVTGVNTTLTAVVLGNTIPVEGYYTVGSLPNNFSPSEGDVVEIYSPLKELEEGFYWEIGESYPVVDGKHYGSILSDPSGQNQTDTQPAIVRLRNEGDVYWRYRLNLASFVGADGGGGYIEDPSISDFSISNFTNQGRFNLVDKQAKRTRREATIYYSESYIPDTNINGLSSFFLESFAEYNQENGSIQKMYSEDRNVILFQELKVGRVLVNSAVFNDLSGQGLVGQSTTVLSDIQYYPGEYGISKNPESFAVYGGNKYFTDIHRGVVLRLGGDGLSPISEAGMHNYFTDTFNELDKGRLNSVVVGEYDKRFEEYVISIRKEIEFNVFRPTITETTVSFELGGDGFVDTTEDTTEDVDDPIDTTGDSGDSGDSTEDSGDTTGDVVASSCSIFFNHTVDILRIRTGPYDPFSTFTDNLGNTLTATYLFEDYGNNDLKTMLMTSEDCSLITEFKLLTEGVSYTGSIQGSLDISGLTGLETLFISQHQDLTTLILPTSAPECRTIEIRACGMTTIDISGFTKIQGDVLLRDNRYLKSVILPASNEVITTLAVGGGGGYSGNLNDVEALDITPLTGANDGIGIAIQNNKISIANINQVLIDLDAKGWVNGILASFNQTPSAPPSGAGLTAKASLQAKGWTVNTD